MMNKRFTLKESNDMLPEVKADLKQLQLLADQLEAHVTVHQRMKSKSPSSDEAVLFELEGKLDFMQHELHLAMTNFARKGILIKMIQPGLIDFPAIIDGEEVLLCWREGEERITHYHGWNDGYQGRKLHPDAGIDGSN